MLSFTIIFVSPGFRKFYHHKRTKELRPHKKKLRVCFIVCFIFIFCFIKKNWTFPRERSAEKERSPLKRANGKFFIVYVSDDFKTKKKMIFEEILILEKLSKKNVVEFFFLTFFLWAHPWTPHASGLRTLVGTG